MVSLDPFFVRNLVYGLEDSFISTTGVVVGVTFAGLPNIHIIITGIVLVLAEALSMAFGSFISEESFLIASKSSYTIGQVIFYATTMFISYVSAGILILIPYFLNLKYNYAYSVGIAIVSIFIIIYFMQHNLKKALLISVLGFLLLMIIIFVGQRLEAYRARIEEEQHQKDISSAKK